MKELINGFLYGIAFLAVAAFVLFFLAVLAGVPDDAGEPAENPVAVQAEITTPVAL